MRQAPQWDERGVRRSAAQGAAQSAVAQLRPRLAHAGTSQEFLVITLEAPSRAAGSDARLRIIAVLEQAAGRAGTRRSSVGAGGPPTH